MTKPSGLGLRFGEAPSRVLLGVGRGVAKSGRNFYLELAAVALLSLCSPFHTCVYCWISHGGPLPWVPLPSCSGGTSCACQNMLCH